MTDPTSRYEEEVRHLALAVHSPSGRMTVTRSPSGAVELTIRPGSLAGRSEQQVGEEIGALLREAVRRFGEARRDLYARTVGSDLADILWDERQ